MPRQSSLASHLCVLGLLLAIHGPATAAQGAARPNVVVILADDQGWGDLSVSGNTNLSTPRIDSLARDGAKFDRFFVCPVCSPTRAEFLTGRYHPRGGVWSTSTGGERLDLDERTFADAGQKQDLAQKRPEVAAKLSQAVSNWKREVLTGYPGDNRPFTVGFREFSIAQLPARDGVAHGNLRRSARAPNCSFFENWTGLDDRMTWDIEVNTAGKYDATIYYTCPAKDVGSTIELSFGESRLQATVAKANDPPLVGVEHDRVPRVGESYMKDFRPLNLGVFELRAGRGPLTLRALKIGGTQVMDVRSVVLTLWE